MPIRRNKDQKKESLIDFYNRDEWTGPFEISARKMLDVINWLNTNFKQTELIGTTSHQRLVIHASENDDSEWSIIISNSGLKEYYIEYKVPKAQSPWENAWIHGTAKDFNEIKQYILIAMKESGNWKGTNEFENLTE
ncbi:MAG: hypothetical protein AAGA66_05310 [Bacteroidota bacterium]